MVTHPLKHMRFGHHASFSHAKDRNACVIPPAPVHGLEGALSNKLVEGQLAVIHPQL